MGEKITQAAEINLDINGDEKIVDIGKELDDATKKAHYLAREFGAISPEALEAQREVAKLTKETTDFNKRVEALNPDKFSQLTTVASGLASGFAAAQGASALFGKENENVEKTLLKVQSAMALSEGLKGISDARGQFGAMAGIIKAKVVKSLTTAKGAARAFGAALGIGIIIAGLAVIVKYWDDIVELMGFGATEGEKLVETTKAQTEAENDKLKALDSQSNVLKMQGYTEEEILQMKQDQIVKVIEASRAEIAAAEIRKAEQIESTKRYHGYLKAAIDFITSPIRLILATVNQIAGVFGKELNLELDTGGLAAMVFDVEETEAEADALIQAQKDGLDQLLNQQAGYELQRQAKAKQDSDKRRAEHNKQAQEDAKRKEDELAKQKEHDKQMLESKIKAEEDFLARTQNEYAETEAATNLHYDNENLALINALANKKITQEGFDQAQEDLRLAKLQKQLQDLIDYGLQTVGIETQIAELKLATQTKTDASTLEAAQATRDARLSIANSLTDATVALGEVLTNNEKKREALAKAAALVQIGIDTAQAISALVRNSEANPLNAPTGGLAGIVQFASGLTRIITNIASAKKLLTGSGQSAPSPGGGGGSSPVPQFREVNQNINVQQLRQERRTDSSGKTQRVILVESDIRENNRRVNIIEGEAEL